MKVCKCGNTVDDHSGNESCQPCRLKLPISENISHNKTIDWQDRKLIDRWCEQLKFMAKKEIEDSGGICLDTSNFSAISDLVGLAYIINEWAEEKYPMNNLQNPAD